VDESFEGFAMSDEDVAVADVAVEYPGLVGM